MTKDEALKLSMEAMEITGGFDVEITAIKEALAQPEPWEKFCDSNCVWTDHHPDCKLAEQEPVFWYRPVGEDGLYEGPIHNASIERVRKLSGAWVPLYPHSQRKEPESVVCVTYKEVADTMNSLWGGTLVQIQIAEEMKNKKLYTTPPQRKPLTDKEIDELRSGYQSGRIGSFVSLARAIEAAHGIKGEA